MTLLDIATAFIVVSAWAIAIAFAVGEFRNWRNHRRYVPDLLGRRRLPLREPFTVVDEIHKHKEAPADVEPSPGA